MLGKGLVGVPPVVCEGEVGWVVAVDVGVVTAATLVMDDTAGMVDVGKVGSLIGEEDVTTIDDELETDV